MINPASSENDGSGSAEGKGLRALSTYNLELYNSLFLTLPFYKVKDTGTLLPLFIKSCEDGVKNSETPAKLIEAFFGKYTPNTDEQDIIDLLFRFIQYIERQVVLFDAVEDASFNKLNIADEQSSLRALFLKANDDKTLHAKVDQLIEDFSLRLVLTAHPTQFYPGSVLAIINDLTAAIKINDITTINQLLQQLGKTPFFNKMLKVAQLEHSKKYESIVFISCFYRGYRVFLRCIFTLII